MMMMIGLFEYCIIIITRSLVYVSPKMHPSNHLCMCVFAPPPSSLNHKTHPLHTICQAYHFLLSPRPLLSSSPGRSSLSSPRPPSQLIEYRISTHSHTHTNSMILEDCFGSLSVEWRSAIMMIWAGQTLRGESGRKEGLIHPI